MVPRKERTKQRKIKRARERGWFWSLDDNHVLYMVLYTLTSLPMMPRPGTQALVVSRADKIYISALFAHSSEIIFIRRSPVNNFFGFSIRHTLESLNGTLTHNINQWNQNINQKKGSVTLQVIIVIRPLPSAYRVGGYIRHSPAIWQPYNVSGARTKLDDN